MRFTLYAVALALVVSAFALPAGADNFEVETEYDEFTGEHSIHLGSVTIHGNRQSARTGESPWIQMAVSAERHEDEEHWNMEILILSANDSRFFRNRSQLDFLLDGERLNFSEADGVDASVSGGSYVEGAIYKIGPDELRRFAEASQIRGRVNTVEFELSDEMVSALEEYSQVFFEYE